jgi:hypothetical protein
MSFSGKIEKRELFDVLHIASSVTLAKRVG